MAPPTLYSHFPPLNFGRRGAPSPSEQRFPIKGECSINRLSPGDNWGALQHHGTVAKSRQTRGVPTRNCPVGVGDARSTKVLEGTPRGLAPRPAPRLRPLCLSFPRGRGTKELREGLGQRKPGPGREGVWPAQGHAQDSVPGHSLPAPRRVTGLRTRAQHVGSLQGFGTRQHSQSHLGIAF